MIYAENILLCIAVPLLISLLFIRGEVRRYVAAFLLPTANYETGKQVMERIRGRFYRKCPSSDVRFDYRLTPLGGGSMLKDKM